MVSVQFLLLICLTASFVSCQQSTSTPSAPTCSNPALLMTPALRGQVLGYINDARNKIKNGQYLLDNGENALTAETMSALTWDCETEEEMRDLANEACRNGVFPRHNYTWFITTTASSHATVVHDGTHYVDIVGYHATYLSQHTIYTGVANGPAPQNYISAIHDKAETIGCAIFDCYINNNNQVDDTGLEAPVGLPPSVLINYFICKVDQEVEFGEKVYEVSAAANANAKFPPPDVICLNTNGMTIEVRRKILEKVNAARQQIQQGTYLLQNTNYALQAVNMPNLIWDCDEEELLFQTLNGLVSEGDAETIFETFVPIDWPTFNSMTLFNSVSAAFDQLYNQNPSLNFLSQSTIYSIQYIPALALSDQATIFACAYNYYFDPTTFSPSYKFLCRAKPSAQINTQLYQI